MSGEKRRQAIYVMLCESDKPISGSMLAKHFQVSRQVIVQDIALLRAKYANIESTHLGYAIPQPLFHRLFYVCHEKDKTIDELNLIVDLGGCVENVSIDHPTYGKIKAELNLQSRRDIQLFLTNMKYSQSKLLTELTKGHHCHLVSAPSIEILDEIEMALKKMDILEHV